MEMVEPIPEITLERQYMVIDYRPVDFAQRASKLWLPEHVDFFLHVRGRRYHHRHSFRDYRLFAVEVDERVQDVREP